MITGKQYAFGVTWLVVALICVFVIAPQAISSQSTFLLMFGMFLIGVVIGGTYFWAWPKFQSYGPKLTKRKPRSR